MRKSPQQQSGTAQPMMALMFLTQLGCCDGREIARHGDLAPEQKSVQLIFMSVMLLICTMFLLLSVVWRMMTTRSCRDVGTQCVSSNSDNDIRSNEQCVHLLCIGEVHHSRSDCCGLRMRESKLMTKRPCQIFVNSDGTRKA